MEKTTTTTNTTTTTTTSNNNNNNNTNIEPCAAPQDGDGPGAHVLPAAPGGQRGPTVIVQSNIRSILRSVAP